MLPTLFLAESQNHLEKNKGKNGRSLFLVSN
jgi:hypothetical protein